MRVSRIIVLFSHDSIAEETVAVVLEFLASMTLDSNPTDRNTPAVFPLYAIAAVGIPDESAAIVECIRVPMNQSVWAMIHLICSGL